MSGYLEEVRAGLIITHIGRKGTNVLPRDIEDFVWALAVLSGNPETEIWALQECEYAALIEKVGKHAEAQAILRKASVGGEQ